MSARAQSELASRIENLINEHIKEWNMTSIEIVGVLEHIKLEVFMYCETVPPSEDCEEDSEEDENADDP